MCCVKAQPSKKDLAERGQGWLFWLCYSNYDWICLTLYIITLNI